MTSLLPATERELGFTAFKKTSAVIGHQKKKPTSYRRVSLATATTQKRITGNRNDNATRRNLDERDILHLGQLR